VYASDGRKLAAIDPFGHLYIDDVIALEQFTELAPVTIQYSASFLAYFHDNVAPVFKNRLTVNVTPPRAGIVMSAPEGIDCADGSNPTIDKSCEKLFKTASQVVLIATPDANGAFPTWTGCNTPADAETASAACTVEMTTGRAVEATYKPKCPPDPPWYKYILVPPDITGTHHYICYPIPNPPPGVMCCPPEGVPPVIELN
jgi:hypothetical protein